MNFHIIAKNFLLHMHFNMLFCTSPAASEPRTTTFCVRFNSPSTMLKSHSFNPLWTMNTTVFQETSSLYHILEPIIARLFQKIIPGRSLGSSFIDPFSFAKKRCNTSQGFGTFFFQSCDQRLFFLFFFFLVFVLFLS